MVRCWNHLETGDAIAKETAAAVWVQGHEKWESNVVQGECGRMVGWLCRWVGGWSVVWLVCWLGGWLVGRTAVDWLQKNSRKNPKNQRNWVGRVEREQGLSTRTGWGEDEHQGMEERPSEWINEWIVRGMLSRQTSGHTDKKTDRQRKSRKKGCIVSNGRALAAFCCLVSEFVKCCACASHCWCPFFWCRFFLCASILLAEPSPLTYSTCPTVIEQRQKPSAPFTSFFCWKIRGKRGGIGGAEKNEEGVSGQSWIKLHFKLVWKTCLELSRNVFFIDFRHQFRWLSSFLSSS